MNRRQGVVRSFGIGTAAVLAMALLTTRGSAEDANARAARLSTVDGAVQIAQRSQVLADSAVANTPLFEGTRVTAADNGRAEIQFEDGSVARLSPNSALTLSALRQKGDGMETEVSLEGGLGYFELQGSDPSIRVRFDDTVLTVSGFTVLRINLDNPSAELAVFSGNAHVERGNALAIDLHGGESVTLDSADASRYNLAESIEPDSWDTWNSDRDQVLTAESAAKTKATSSLAGGGNPAWGDLDANGNWYNVPDTGYVWSPYEAAGAGWDPYGNGYWQWTPRFGYVWVSGNSWGYMPYQCGMWNFYDGFGWGWAPGTSGCQTWWGSGYIGPNIGYAPGGYLPPRWPRRPINGPPGGGRGRSGPQPLIAVNRHSATGNLGLVARDRNTPVMIGGQAVQALRPLAPRQQYDRSSSVNGSRSPSGNAGRQGYTPPPSYSMNRGTGAAFTAGSNGNTHPTSPSRSTSGNTSSSHPYGAGTSSSGRSSASSSATSGGSRSGGESAGGGSRGGGNTGGNSNTHK